MIVTLMTSKLRRVSEVLQSRNLQRVDLSLEEIKKSIAIIPFYLYFCILTSKALEFEEIAFKWMVINKF